MVVGWSADEKAAFVEQYLRVPYGCKGEWVRAHGVSPHLVQRWKRLYLLGDLDRGLLPRDAGGAVLEGERVKRLLEENEHLKARLEQAETVAAELDVWREKYEAVCAEKDRFKAESEAFKAENAKLERVNDLLGKAIGLLHTQSGKQEPDTKA